MTDEWIAARDIVIARSKATKQSRMMSGLPYGYRHCEERSDEAIQKEFEMNNKQGYIYILFSKRNGTLYTGVTSNLAHRVYEHKNKLLEGFTKKYNVDKLGYFEVFDDITKAIEREKQIKAGSRKNKIKLIESMNPEWKDLYNEIL